MSPRRRDRHALRRRSPMATRSPPMSRARRAAGAVQLSSNYRYPGRYTRWDVAVADPPLGISSFGRAMWLEAYNERGGCCSTLSAHLAGVDEITLGARAAPARPHDQSAGRIYTGRSARRCRPCSRSAFDHGSLLLGRDASIELSSATISPSSSTRSTSSSPSCRPARHGAVPAGRDPRGRQLFRQGLDRPLRIRQGRQFHGGQGWRHSGRTLQADRHDPPRDIIASEYAELVKKAKLSFQRGDLFEVVPDQKFMERCDSKPSDISKRLKAINPSPYSFFMDLGNQEYLIGFA